VEYKEKLDRTGQIDRLVECLPSAEFRLRKEITAGGVVRTVLYSFLIKLVFNITFEGTVRVM